MSRRYGVWGYCDQCGHDSWVVPYGPYDDVIDPEGYICGGGCDADEDDDA